MSDHFKALVINQEEENFTLGHFRDRINIYNEEGFDYDIHNVEL